MAELVAHPWWPEALQVRRWDDASKVPGAAVVTIDEILDQLRPAFASR
jgi:predicted HD phosphohydrolase